MRGRGLFRRQHRRDRQSTGQARDHLFAGQAQAFHFRRARGLDLDGEHHIAVAHYKACDHAQIDHISVPCGITNPAQRVQNFIFTYPRHIPFPK